MGEAVRPAVDGSAEVLANGAFETNRTSNAARTIAVAIYLTIFVSYCYFVLLPSDSLQLFGWIWLATIAWNIQAPLRSHLAFPRDWWPALVVLQVYFYSRAFADDIGLTVHVTEPITADTWLGGGELPTQRLQSWLCGNPCVGSLPPHWYDPIFTAVYYSHFIAAPTIAAILWVRSRDSWLPFMRRYVSLYVAGLFIYITYPMAPPWMASEEGYVTGQPVARITGRGWAQVGLEHLQHWLAQLSNPVAAMPSLHAGTAALIAFYAISRLRGRWQGWAYLLLLYPLTMSFMLVYYGEHYLVDIIAGFALALLVMGACTQWERQGRVRALARDASSALLGLPTGSVYAAVGIGRDIELPRQRRGTAGDWRESSPPSRWGSPGRTWIPMPRRRRILLRLVTMPALVLPSVVVVLVMVSLMASPYAAMTATLILLGFGAVTSWLAWPDLPSQIRAYRMAAMVALLLLVLGHLLHWI